MRKQKLQKQQIYISCIVPVHNEAQHIAQFLQELTQTLITLTHRFEIIVIEDGSQDQSLTILESLIPQYPIKLISLSRNFGKENALVAGLLHANGDLAIIIDSDFQHPIALLKTFIEYWAEGYDMVYGVRQDRHGETFIKKTFAAIFYRLMHWLTKTKIPANAGDFRLLDRIAIDAINRLHERGIFMKGLYAWIGFKSIAVPFKVEARKSGNSSWRFKHLFELALTSITAFSDIPLRIWGVIGAIVSFMSLIYGSFILLRTLIHGTDLPGFATIVVAVMFLGGMQLLSIGIMGEYIARIFHEVKARPRFLIGKRVGFDPAQDKLPE